MSLSEKHEHRGLTVEIHYDPDAESPRQYDNAGTLVLAHRRYNLPNEIDFNFDAHEGWVQVETAIRREHDVVGFLWVQGYDHGHLILRAQHDRTLSDPWDSGIAGFIFMTRGDQTKIGIDDENIDACLVAEVEEYNAWSNGEAYGFIVKDEDGQELDACWGFVNDEDYCLTAGKDAADVYADKRDAEDASALLPIQVTT